MNQLTPTEKAKELVEKFASPLDVFKININSKRCALVACNEIIDAIDWHESETPTKQLNYWLDVRKELEKNY